MTAASRPLRARLDAASLWMRFYVGRSLSLDRSTLGLDRWPLRARRRFLASKAAAIPRLQSGRAAVVVAGAVDFTAADALELGTFQSCLIDVHDELIAPGLIDPQSAPVVVDVGANVGQFLCAIKAFAPAATVLSVEPDPDSHESLAINAARLQGVTTQRVAVGEERGELLLHRHHVSMMATLRPSTVEDYDPSMTVPVPVAPLDELTGHLPVVDLLKIDVEGFEVEALRGAVSLLRRTRLLVLEIGLARASDGANLEALTAVRELAPTARIVRFGRPLGSPADPICQDVVIDLHPPD